MKKSGIFPGALALTPVVELVANATPFPTHLNLAYRLLVFGLALSLCPLTLHFVRGAVSRAVLPAMYVLTFIVVSYYGVNFEYSVRYRVLLLPLQLMDWLVWFMAAYFYEPRYVFMLIARAAAVFAIGSLLFAAVGIIDPEETRIIHGLDVPIAIPAAVVSGSSYLAGLLLFASLLSLKKTVLACGLGGYMLAKGLSKLGGTSRVAESARSASAVWGALRMAALVVTCAVLALAFLDYLVGTLLRFSVDGEDLYRLAAANEFLRLFQEYFPQGTGYYTFGFLTQDTIPYAATTVDGQLIEDGMALHNTFMHIALEGGLPILIVSALLALSFARYCLQLWKRREVRIVAIVLISWAAVGFVFGMLQQLHGTRYYFGILGFAAGAVHACRRSGARESIQSKAAAPSLAAEAVR